MSKFGRTLAVLVLLSALASCACAVTLKPGTYQLKWRILKEHENTYTQANMELDRTQVAQKKRFVGLPAGETYWGEDGSILLLIAKQKPSDKQFNVAYLWMKVAKGAKVDLTHAVTITLAADGTWSMSGGPDYPYLSQKSDEKLVRIDWEMGDGEGRVVKKTPIEVSVRFQPDDKDQIKPYDAYINVLGEWFGTVDTDEGKLDVRTGDYDGNGRYNDRTNADGDGDAIFLSDGSENADFLDDRGTVCLGKAGLYDGKLYVVNVSSSGNQVEIQPYTGPTGTLIPEVVDAQGDPAADYEIWLLGDSGMYRFGLENVVVPPGEYTASAFIRDGKSGSPFDDDYYYGVRATSRTKLAVEEGKAVERHFGGPVKLTIEPGKEAIEGKLNQEIDIKLDFDIGGDEFGFNGSRTPKTQVKDSSGKVIHNGQGEFGCLNDAAWYTLKVPASWKPGDYTFIVTFDARPYQKKITSSKTLRIVR